MKSDLLIVSLETKFLEQVALETCEVDPARFELVPEPVIFDADLQRIFTEYGRELGNAALGEKLYAEVLTTQLSLHLLRRYVTQNEISICPSKHPVCLRQCFAG